VKLYPWSIRFGIAVVLLAGMVTIVRSQPEGAAVPLDMIWSRPVPNLMALAVSPEGDRALAVDQDHVVRSFDERGTPRWERPVPGADTVALGRRGSLCMAYASRHPLFREVYFFDDAGQRVGVLRCPDMVSTAAVAPDGRFAAVACGKTVFFCSRKPNGFKFRPVSLPGQARQLQFGPGDTVYASCQDPQCVELVKSTGKVLWRRKNFSVTSCSISASEDGKWLALGSQRPRHWVEVALVNFRNERQWAAARPGRAPRVRLSAAGNAVMLAYEHKVEHEAESRFERRLAYLVGGEAPGTVLEAWTKGGAYTAPLSLSLERQGEWAVALDTQQDGPWGNRLPSFRLYGRSGERRWIYNSPTGILLAVSSCEGRHIAAYRSDGVIELLRVLEP
jgi:hypothetical protein